MESRDTFLRRPHRKSGNGCNGCKRRHLKCDESVPQCTRCVRQGLRCAYLDGAPIALLGGRTERAILPTPSAKSHTAQARAPIAPAAVSNQNISKQQLGLRGDSSSFHFVNHNAENLSAPSHPNRRAVLVHVQNKYHNLRKQKEARQLRASPKVPKSGFHVLKFVTKPPPPPSPISFVRKGNSDPFNAFSIPIDAEVNALLSFDREVLHPSWHAAAQVYAPSVKRANSDWSKVIVSFYTKTTAYGYLARTAIALASATPGSTYARTALIFRTESSRLLRGDLVRRQEQNNNITDEQLQRSIWALMQAELFARNFEAAAIHSRMLSSLFQQQHENGRQAKAKPLDLSFVDNVLRNDHQRAAMTLTRPIFDVQPTGWIARLFDSVWQDLISVLSPMPIPNLNPSIQSSPALSPLFHHARNLLFVLYSLITKPQLATDNFWICFHLHVSLLLGRFLDRYVDISSTSSISSWFTSTSSPMTSSSYTKSTSSSIDASLEAATCLAAALWIRLAGNSDGFRISPHLPPVCNVTPTILEALRSLLSFSSSLTSSTSLNRSIQAGDNAHTHARLCLWILHTAAQAEQADGDGYFTTALAAQIHRMRIGDWEECQKILQGFLFAESVHPHGEKWFEKLLSIQGTLPRF